MVEGRTEVSLDASAGGSPATAAIPYAGGQPADDQGAAAESPPAPRRSRLGQQIGPYQILAEVGRGGMAVVYKAVQTHLHRNVAVKVLPATLAHDESFRSRFQREAEMVAALQHPNILPIYDFGQHQSL